MNSYLIVNHHELQNTSYLFLSIRHTMFLHQLPHQCPLPSTNVPIFAAFPSLPLEQTHFPSTIALVFPFLIYPTSNSFKLQFLLLLKKSSLFEKFLCLLLGIVIPLGRFFHIPQIRKNCPLPLTNYTEHDTLKIHPCSSKLHDIIFSYYWVLQVSP